MTTPRAILVLSVTAAAAVLTTALTALAQPAKTAALFPTPFVVEHYQIDTSQPDVPLTSEPVIDHYGGNWLISVQGNGSRKILDFAKRELTEVDARSGTYSVVTFGRLGELRARLDRAMTNGASTKTASRADAAPKAERPAIVVEELGDMAAQAVAPPRSRAASGSSRAVSASDSHEIAATMERILETARRDADAKMAKRPNTRHFRAAVPGGAGALEAWLDTTIRLTPEARAAIESFERDSLGPRGVPGDEPTASELLSAIAKKGDGFPMRTRQQLGKGAVDDVATRIEPAASAPTKLLAIPESFRRVPHPLEMIVTMEEEEARFRQAAAEANAPAAR